MIVSLGQVSYYLNNSLILNLKVSGELSFNLDLSFAVRDDWPELRNILDKAMKQMPEKTKTDIYDKWINLDLNQVVSKGVLLHC